MTWQRVETPQGIPDWARKALRNIRASDDGSFIVGTSAIDYTGRPEVSPADTLDRLRVANFAKLQQIRRDQLDAEARKRLRAINGAFSDPSLVRLMVASTNPAARSIDLVSAIGVARDWLAQVAVIQSADRETLVAYDPTAW